MCGITACFDMRMQHQHCNGDIQNTEKRRVRIAAQLDRSIESMRHRGPDAKGIWISQDNSAGLGHARLSTRDLSSAGDQPLHSGNPDDEIHAVVNGEIYYDDTLRQSLMTEYNFQSTSDSEIAIALYVKYGVDFVDHLRGEFSIVLYDGKERSLVVARDRFGIKPLHYAVFGNRFLIATQCKGIVELMDEPQLLQWDPKCLSQGGGHYGNRTLFKGISKFPPGHILVYRLDRDEDLIFKPYFRIEYPFNEGSSDNRPADRLIEELRERLLEAVRIRLMSSDVPVGILLSGGVDSGAVAGMAAHCIQQWNELNPNTKHPLPTCFTIAFPDDEVLDESAAAMRTAQYLGLPVERVVVTETIIANEFDEACWLGETLMWDLQHIAKKALSRYIHSKAGLKVVLNGDGSDELFGGYSHFVADRLVEDDRYRAKSLQNISSMQRERLRQKYDKDVTWFGMEDNTRHRHKNKVAENLGLPPAFSNLAVSRHDEWLSKDIRKLSDPYQAIHDCFTAEELKRIKRYHPLHRSMMAWTKTMLPNLVIAAISDGAEMAHSVESRPPFLDNRVAEFVYTLPVDMLVHLDDHKPPVEKWIFREAVKPFVTEEVYQKRKKAFAAPFRWKKGGPLFVKLTSLITKKNVESLGFAEWNKCAHMVDETYDTGDQRLFRRTIWLAQIISIGLQFQVQPLVLHDKKARSESSQKTLGTRKRKLFDMQSDRSKIAKPDGIATPEKWSTRE